MAYVRCKEQSATALALPSAAELLPRPAGPGWQMCGVRKNLAQLQRCCAPVKTCRSWMADAPCEERYGTAPALLSTAELLARHMIN